MTVAGTLGVGILGSGPVTQAIHLPALARLTDQFTVRTVMDANDATAHQWYGNFLSILGRVGPSLASFERAVALDPLASIRHAALGWGYYFARQYDRALDQCRRTLEIDASLPVAHHWLALVSEELGLWDQAEAAMETAAELSGRDGGSLASLATTLARRGREPEARALLADLDALRQTTYVSAYDFATMHTALGEIAEHHHLQWQLDLFLGTAGGGLEGDVDAFLGGYRAFFGHGVLLCGCGPGALGAPVRSYSSTTSRSRWHSLR